MNIARRTFLMCAAAGALTIAVHAADFSYYMLALSYAPNYCAQPGADRDPRQCGVTGRPFVVHGLSPQRADGSGPENCPSAQALPAGLVQSMMQHIPSEKLIRREWSARGACTGLPPAEYFATLLRLADSVRIPPQFNTTSANLSISPAELEGEFQRVNPGVPRDGFRVSCYADNGLREVRVCFDKALNAAPCSGAPECTKHHVVLRPVPQRR